MIAELIKLADLNGLTGHEPTRQRPIHWFIDLDSEGRVVGFSPTTAKIETKKGKSREERGKQFATFTNYYMQWKSGKVQGVCTNQNDWLPDFLSGSAVLIFKSGVPGSEDEEKKRLKKHEMWRNLVLKAASENPANKVIAAVANFVKLNADFAVVLRFVPEEKRQETANLLIEFGGKLSFRIQGKIALTDPELAKWWASLVAARRQEVTKHLPVGSDNYMKDKGALTESFPRFKANIALASFDAAPFVSYGLGNQTTTLRIESAEKTAAGLRLLLESENTSMWLGDYTAVFWTVPVNFEARVNGVPFVGLMAQPDPLSVKDFLNGVWGSHPGKLDEAKFYAALLSIPPQGRFSLHSWHTETLNKAKENILSYFRAVALGDSDGEIPSVRQLAFATIAKSKKQKTSPDAELWPHCSRQHYLVIMCRTAFWQWPFFAKGPRWRAQASRIRNS